MDDRSTTEPAVTPAPLDVQVAITLCSVSYLGEGTPTVLKRGLMLGALAAADLPTAGQWNLVWGPAEYDSDLWFIVEGPDERGVPTLAVVIRGTQMDRWISLQQDLQLGQAPVPFTGPTVSPRATVSNGFIEAFHRLRQCSDGGVDALTYLRRRLGSGRGVERIHVVGHSLGGGLAPLVGLWLASEFQRRSISVFPFGGQSTGNAVFASDYRRCFPHQPSRWITDLDVTPLMFADLGQLATFWPIGPNPPASLLVAISELEGLWSQYQSTDDAYQFHATMYPASVQPGPAHDDAWTAQTHHQHEHRYYMYLAGIPLQAITNTFGSFPPPPGVSHERG